MNNETNDNPWLDSSDYENMKSQITEHDFNALYYDVPKTPARTRYLQRLPAMREIARMHGYALAVHGSETRDFDVIAVPWVETTSTADVLVEDIRQAIDGTYSIDKAYPVAKPHGRLAWSIQIGGGLYIDISVMPIQVQP